MFTVFQDSNNHIQIPFKGDFDYLLIKFTYRNKIVFGIFENTKGNGCDYEINIIEVGSDGTVDKENGRIKLSPRSTWKAKIYGQDNNINLAPENATFLYDYDFQIKGDSCVVYPSGSTDCLTATAIVEDQDGNVLATEEIPSGATEKITLNVANTPLYAYNYPALSTGQDTIYAEGDDKWVMDNILSPEIESWPNNRLLVFPIINSNDHTKLSRGATPEGTNIFGNLERFTDEDGLQMYNSGVVIDHLTGLMTTISTNPDGNANPSGDEGNWISTLDYHRNRVFYSKSDWFTGNWMMYDMLALKNNIDGLNYNPYNFNIQVIEARIPPQLFTSSTSKNNTSSSPCYSNGYSNADLSLPYRFIGNEKSANKRKGISFRKAFTYDPTQDINKLILS